MTEYCTPVIWDNVKFAFIPVEIVSGSPPTRRMCMDLQRVE